MIDFRNPYTPGSGRMPPYLAGRDKIIDQAIMYIKATTQGYPQRSVAYYGLRGVGKTVLLNSIETHADNLPVLYEHIEIKEEGSFIKDMSVSSKKFITSMSTKESLKSGFTKLIGVFKSFNTTWNPEDNTWTFGMSDDSKQYETAGTGELSFDMVELLVSLGKVAQSAGQTICFFIDEIQYLKDNELEALLMALHRVNQLGLPILVFCAGLPKILKKFGEVKSYAERLFEYTEIDSIKKEEAVKAIVNPANKIGIKYSEEAIEEILSITNGYPYFIQALCNTIWRTQQGTIINKDEVLASVELYNQELDKSFFMVRYNRCTPKEKEFMFAMTKCGELPCTIANVAQIMKRNVKSISPTRGKLIDKGLIYATGHAEIDFTVPQFDKFLLRINKE